EIEILTLDTTLEGAPVVPVSTLTGAGLDALRAEIAAQLGRPAGPPPPGYFRLPVDRAFVIRGHGVVVTGTAIAGSVREGDTLRVLPGGQAALPPRSAGWAQLVLAEPVLAMRGDRFILRDETARRTLGGGVVVNPFADRHRRAEAGLEDRLEVLRGGETPAAARAFLEL